MLVNENELPAFSLRKNNRAHALKIYVSEERGVELLVPRGCSQREALEFMREKRAWLNKYKSVIERYEQRKQARASIPQQIHLAAIEHSWQVFYNVDQSRTRTRLRQIYGSVYIDNHCDDLIVAQQALVKWLKKLARYEFKPWLDRLSMMHNLAYAKLAIRDQKTCWGSCSADKNISLNYKLLFLAPCVVNYVLLHELVHTMHLNHSKQFWQTVASIDENYKQHRSLLKASAPQLPLWLPV